MFTGEIEGEEVYTTYRLSYRLEPKIQSVGNIVKEVVSDRLYNVYFTVEYVGSDHLKVGFGQPDSSVIVNIFVYESYLAHCCLTNLSRAYEATVYIAASNEYGTVEYEFELPAYDQAMIEDSCLDEESVILRTLIDTQGRIVWQSPDQQFPSSTLPHGFYVITTEYQNGKVTIKKTAL